MLEPPRALKNLGISIKDGQKIDLNKIVGRTFKVISNNNYYQEIAAKATKTSVIPASRPPVNLVTVPDISV